MIRMIPIAAAIVCNFACNVACREITSPPPPQRAEIPHPVRAIIDMTGGRPADTWASVVSDVEPNPDPQRNWTWTRAHPTFKFRLHDSVGWNLTVRLTAVEKVLATTGPQHVTFEVNGKSIGTSVLDRSRQYDLTFPVATALLQDASPTTVRLDIQPCLVVGDGSFGVLLHSIGFVKDSQ